MIKKILKLKNMKRLKQIYSQVSGLLTVICILFILKGWLFDSSVYAQTISTSATEGKEFYVTYFENYTRVTTLQMKVVVHKASYITAKYNNQPNLYWNNWNNTLVQPGIYTFDVSYNDVVNTTTATTNKSITLSSSEDVNVYAINYYNASSDATCILPTPTWGTEYRLATGIPSFTSSSLYSVVAKEDNTVVTLHNNSTVTLNTGEVYHHYQPPIDLTGIDLTGMKVSSTKQVAVFSGAHITMGPTYIVNYCSSFIGTSTSDHTYEQLWSFDKWGKDFFAWPILTPNSANNWGGMLAIVANEIGTNITLSGGINGGTPVNYTLNAGDKQYVCYVMTGLTRIVSNKSIMVFLILPDATVMSIPATGQRIRQATVAPFILSGATNINAHGIDLLVPAAYWDQMEIKENGVVVSNSTYTVNTSSHFPDWYNIHKNLADTDITIDLTCPVGFLAFMSGSGTAETYAYVAGAGAYDLRNYFTIQEQSTTIDTHYENTSPYSHTFESTDQIVVKRTIESSFSSISWLINGTPYSITENANMLNTLNFPASALSPGENYLTMSVHYLGATADSVYTGSVWSNANDSTLITANGTIICSGDATNLSASLSIPGSVIDPVFRWYDAITDGTLLHTDPTYTPSPNLTTTTTYYVSVSGSNLLESSRKAVTVTVSPRSTPNMIIVTN